MEDPLFSPENLRRLAEQQRLEEEEELAKRAVIEGPKINLSATFGIDELLHFPISFTTEQLICDLKFAGKIKLKLVASLRDFQDAYRIQNRAERVLKLREIIKFEATDGQLMILE
jgi:hypothetical protein